MPHPETLGDHVGPPLTKAELDTLREGGALAASAVGGLAAAGTWTFAQRKRGGWRFWSGVFCFLAAAAWSALVANAFAEATTAKQDASPDPCPDRPSGHKYRAGA